MSSWLRLSKVSQIQGPEVKVSQVACPFKLLFPVTAGRHLCMHTVLKSGNKKPFICWYFDPSVIYLDTHTHTLSPSFCFNGPTISWREIYLKTYDFLASLYWYSSLCWYHALGQWSLNSWVKWVHYSLISCPWEVSERLTQRSTPWPSGSPASHFQVRLPPVMSTDVVTVSDNKN